jgi:flagellar hook-length control protein FliK
MGAFISKISMPVSRILPPIVGGLTANPGSSRGLVEVGRSFGQILHQTQPVARKTDSRSVPQQLLALFASGMPLSSIVNQVASALAAKVANAMTHGTQAAIDNVSKNKLLQAFASALAPPGGSPPGSSAEQAQSLAQRLQQLVANVAGVAAANAGQQNRFAGNILDANSAKEIPAQQQSEQSASSDAAIASFIESVLSDAAAQLQASATANAPVQTMPVLTAPQTAVQQPAPSTAQTVAQVQTQSAKQTESQPGDILGRIIARAVTSAARFNAPAATATAAVSAPVNKATPVTNVAGNDTQPSAVRASIDSLVSAIVDGARSSGGNTSNGGNFGGQNSNLFNLGQFASGAGATKLATLTSDGGSFAQQTNALAGPMFQLGNVQTATTPLAPPAPYTTVDPNSVIEQVIKGLQVRNFGPDNSEVRMHLSPENLGDVSVKLSMNGGNISASITAQSADVRDALLANQSQLQRSLADAGLKLQNFSVNVSGGGPNGFAQHQGLAQHAGTRHIAFHMGNSDETQGDVLPATPTFGPPLAAVQTLGLLNYLA